MPWVACKRRRHSQRSPHEAIVKHEGFRLVISLTILGMLLGMPLAGSQETSAPSPGSKSAELPSAPSATLATTCTENNGNPCPEWVHNLVGQYPPLPESTTSQ